MGEGGYLGGTNTGGIKGSPKRCFSKVPAIVSHVAPSFPVPSLQRTRVELPNTSDFSQELSATRFLLLQLCLITLGKASLL